MSYKAIVTREGNDWLAEVPELPGAHAFARTLSGLRTEISDAIVLADDLPDDAVVDVTLEMAGDTAFAALVEVRHALDLAAKRQVLNRQVTDLVEETEAVARRLIAAGLSVRDAAGALDISPGRVSQLIKS